MSSASSTQKQQQQQYQYQARRRNHNSQQSRNTNAYCDRKSVINNYWNYDYQRSNEEFYNNNHYYHQQQQRNIYPLSSASQRIRKTRDIQNDQRYYSSSFNNNYSYYDNIPPRHRLQQQNDKREQHIKTNNTNNKLDEVKPINTLTNNEKVSKPLQSASSSSTNSDVANNRKDLHTKNLAAAAIAARQQNSQPQTNLGMVQTLMNSLILQQQQQPSQSQSTVQLQYQLTNALLTTMIQQRLKEAALQAQAQQIQAALPTLLAAQALAYQQQQPTLPPNVAHPGTKFNNRPLVKFPIIRPTMMMTPIIRPPIMTNNSRHRLGIHTQQTNSTTVLPTYQQVQEIERGISLDEAIHLKGAIDIADLNNKSISDQAESNSINNNNNNHPNE